MPFTYEYPRPALTVDCIVFGRNESDDLKVLLIERKNDPFAGRWAFPGGFVDMEETVEAAAARELEEETGLKNIVLEQLHTFSAVNRDPRGRVVSVVFVASVNIRDHDARAADDAENVAWFSVSNPPDLAFDHEQILETALARIHKQEPLPR